ncbi:hypothetical protein [Neisseria montereyensis]|uniref:Uncharacterized protein n=1 Tax=Neisseria montereyensis TaxID=2973938 RepID=A0ABT2F9Q8_9NEIS|nr:hypothetical protein [Neisseria montereyensis]MCS4532929.1 hypothetical protein [Neisseria montereyensis]
MIQYFHHINRFVGYQYPTYACFQTACRGGLYIRPRYPIQQCNPLPHMPKPHNRGCILPIAQFKQRADMQSAPTNIS